MALLCALHLPAKVNITHCPGHQKDSSPVTKGNSMADWQARRIARETVLATAVSADRTEPLPPFQDTAEELILMAKTEKDFDKDKGVWRIFLRKKILPQKETEAMVRQMYQWTHLGVKKLMTTALNTKFTRHGNKYLLVFVNTFSGWVVLDLKVSTLPGHTVHRE